MKFNDVMTSAEAAERWKISPVTVKQACSGQRNTPPRFTSEECRKSKGTWLVSRQGMERLYGEEPKMLKVYSTATQKPWFMGTAETYKEAWDDGDMEEEFPDFVWPEGVDYVWTADWIAEVVLDPTEYNEEGVRNLIDELLLSYEIIEEIE